MSLLNFLKKKELAEIASLKQDLSKASSQIAELQELNNKLAPLQKYSTIQDLESETIRLKAGNDELIRYRDIILGNYDKALVERRQELDILDDEILLQTFGIYTPLYDFQKLDDYKENLMKFETKKKT